MINNSPLGTTLNNNNNSYKIESNKVISYLQKWYVSANTTPPNINTYYRDSPHLYSIYRKKSTRYARGFIINILAKFDSNIVDTFFVEWHFDLLYEDYSEVNSEYEGIKVQNKYYDTKNKIWTYLLCINEISSKHSKRRFRVKIYSNSMNHNLYEKKLCIGTYIGPFTVKTKRSKENCLNEYKRGKVDNVNKFVQIHHSEEVLNFFRSKNCINEENKMNLKRDMIGLKYNTGNERMERILKKLSVNNDKLMSIKNDLNNDFFTFFGKSNDCSSNMNKMERIKENKENLEKNVFIRGKLVDAEMWINSVFSDKDMNVAN